MRNGRPGGQFVMPATNRPGPSMSVQSATKSRPGRTQSTRRCKMDNGPLIKLLLILPLLMLIAACGSRQIEPPAVPQARSAAIPALPPQARQPPVPSWCLPTCSSALIKERKTWQQLLINAEQGE